MNKIMFTAALGAMLAGCTSVNVVKDYGYLNEAQQGLHDLSHNPYYIDYNVAPQRVTAEGMSSCWCWFFASDDGVAMDSPRFTLDAGVAAAKDSATYKAVENAKCDALMGCIYEYIKTSKWLGFYKETKCSVKGFPASVKSINLIQDRPVVIDKDKQIIRLKPWESIEPPKKSGSIF